jgi:membrane protein implicated in regulation of membrane protease activity
MTGQKKKQRALIAACMMTLVAVIYLITGLMGEMSWLQIVVVVLFSISAGLYWYRYKTEQFEDD